MHVVGTQCSPRPQVDRVPEGMLSTFNRLFHWQSHSYVQLLSREVAEQHRQAQNVADLWIPLEEIRGHKFILYPICNSFGSSKASSNPHSLINFGVCTADADEIYIFGLKNMIMLPSLDS